MKDIRIADKFSELNIRMCEKHFQSYRIHMMNAAAGGTSYSFQSTSGRGCDICKKERDNEQ